MSQQTAVKIAIIGGGFAGTALLATLVQSAKQPLVISIYEKSGQFGAGPAYRTPYRHHLLNVRASDMSAFEDRPNHFVEWLQQDREKLHYLNPHRPLAEQFVPRCFYYEYLQHLLADIKANTNKNIVVNFIAAEVLAINTAVDQSIVLTTTLGSDKVDKVVLALGNNPPSPFPFPVAADMLRIDNPWDYTAIAAIKPNAAVLIVGTGLSMIDAVLTLHQQGHTGPIYALSRHGLLPLPHSDVLHVEKIDKAALLSLSQTSLVGLTADIRKRAKQHMEHGGDWRSVIGGVRPHVIACWQQASLKDRRRFLRHVLPYWNIHRHRVHTEIMDVLQAMMVTKQLTILSGRILHAENNTVTYMPRHETVAKTVPVSFLVNCMGPMQHLKQKTQPLIDALLQQGIASLDPLQLGLAVTPALALKDSKGQISANIYAIGSPTRGEFWEITAVPDIRKQIFDLVQRLWIMERNSARTT